RLGEVLAVASVGEEERDLADLDPVAEREDEVVGGLAVHERPVAAARVEERDLVTLAQEAHVALRDAAVGEAEVAVVLAPDEHLALLDREGGAVAAAVEDERGAVDLL